MDFFHWLRMCLMISIESEQKRKKFGSCSNEDSLDPQMELTFTAPLQFLTASVNISYFDNLTNYSSIVSNINKVIQLSIAPDFINSRDISSLHH